MSLLFSDIIKLKEGQKSGLLCHNYLSLYYFNKIPNMLNLIEFPKSFEKIFTFYLFVYPYNSSGQECKNAVIQIFIVFIVANIFYFKK